MEGRESEVRRSGRTVLDWILVGGTTVIFIVLATFAQIPRMEISLGWTAAISAMMLALLLGCAISLWPTTRFN